jgi:hypothetical protein
MPWSVFFGEFSLVGAFKSRCAATQGNTGSKINVIRAKRVQRRTEFSAYFNQSMVKLKRGSMSKDGVKACPKTA